ncbi:unnamed protein product [Rotaria sp. Silwood1]|nr:unnamed protein product [Rotaria sp. Silwood1]CAF0962427.1 unnamed protein product [Rotaria sp. Silwood1]CAF3348175.1 unnamed protein product [Rotaria sp. Silwood1]CAF4553740.1 unnamed protein product [Rotaria sp. Silwood1]
MNMESPFSPPVLYLTDDDNDGDTQIDLSMPYGNSFKTTMNENLPHKKRKLPNTNAHINPSMLNWSKRQRNDNYGYHHHHYQQQQQQQQLHMTKHFINHDPETIVIDPDESINEQQESHSFFAFDWSSESPTSTRTYLNPIQTASRVSMPPLNTVMNTTKHHLDPSETVPLFPRIHPNDRYLQQAQRKTINIPMSSSSSPPLPLPLPTATSAFTRPTAQRVQPGKIIRIPYAHSIPPPPPPVIVGHRNEPMYQPTFHSPPPVPLLATTPTPEIRRQALNGNGILSAFYDSKCYRCNICKFKSVTSSLLLQHLFTHIFFCHQCSFYTYSHHNLYQHIFEKHHSHFNDDNFDPKKLDLLYVTRCQDGTFALCMDSSPPQSKISTSSSTITHTDEQLSNSSTTNNIQKPKRKPLKKKPPVQNKVLDTDIVLLPEKQDIKSQPSSSSLSSSSLSSSSLPIKKHSKSTEKQTHTYVLMKHRRCFSGRNPLCLHSLTLEYMICREHTIRRMCKTQGILKRQNIQPKLTALRLIDEVSKCLKTIINDIVNMEEYRDSHNLICALPNNIINLIFPTEDLNTLMSALKLNNRYDKAIEQNHQYDSEHSVRKNTKHIFILSSSETNNNEQIILTSLHSSITNTDSTFIQTTLNKLPISYENTHRFLKGTIKPFPRTTDSNSKPLKKNNMTSTPTPSGNPEPIYSYATKLAQHKSSSSTSPIIDRNNNSIASSAPKKSSTPSVIILD